MSNYIQSNQVVALPAPLLASLTNLIAKADSGKILTLGPQTAIQTFTLPLPEPGLYYRIICTGILGFAVTIATNPVSLFYGSLTNVSTVSVTTASVGVAATGSYPIVVAAKGGATYCIFTATAVSGDYMEMVCNGTNWYVKGMSTTPFVSVTSLAVTLAAAGLN
jgi:hypothetical protein